MANSKSGKAKKQDKRADSKKRDIATAEIRRAEKRLSEALASVDAAREKVQRRERDLAKLMNRYGHTPPVSAAEAIPLESTSQIVTENGASQPEDDVVEPEQDDAPIELPATTDSHEHQS